MARVVLEAEAKADETNVQMLRRTGNIEKHSHGGDGDGLLPWWSASEALFLICVMMRLAFKFQARAAARMRIRRDGAEG